MQRDKARTRSGSSPTPDGVRPVWSQTRRSKVSRRHPGDISWRNSFVKGFFPVPVPLLPRQQQGLRAPTCLRRLGQEGKAKPPQPSVKPQQRGASQRSPGLRGRVDLQTQAESVSGEAVDLGPPAGNGISAAQWNILLRWQC